tara:strand:+ start:26 stop:424 length:399 start_codon:yes stop_codon:yes gene_type:complete
MERTNSEMSGYTLPSMGCEERFSWFIDRVKGGTGKEYWSGIALFLVIMGTNQPGMVLAAVMQEDEVRNLMPKDVLSAKGEDLPELDQRVINWVSADARRVNRILESLQETDSAVGHFFRGRSHVLKADVLFS